MVQIQDNLEMILATFLIIVGVILLSLIGSLNEVSIEKYVSELSSDKSNVETLDIKFMGTDLYNTLKLEIDEEYTFGELAAHFPSEDKFLFDEDYVSNYQLMLLCDDNLKDSLGELLTPVYGNDWSIWVYEENNLIFACPFGILDGYTANQSIPSTTPGTNLEIILEVEK